MTNVPSTETADRSLTRDILDATRYYLGGRRTLFVLAAVLILGGVALNWGGLVAAGLAPILIALLPCAVMCALGLCMHKMAGGAHTGKRSGVANNATDLESEMLDLIDPVSQRAVPAGTAIASVHRGQVYYFEDRANRETFEAAPEKYLAGAQLVGQRIASSDKSEVHSHKGHGCCG
jgi:YHS domain-containing protein